LIQPERPSKDQTLDGRCVSFVRNHDRALIGRPREQAEVRIAAEIAVANGAAGRDKAGQAGQALRAAQRLKVFVEHLVGRGLSVVLADGVVELENRRVVPRVERDGRRRRDAAVMTRPAGDALHAAEVGAIDPGHHLHHPARRDLARRVDDEIGLVGARVGMAVGAVEARGWRR
jgi:hypothetical protein